MKANSQPITPAPMMSRLPGTLCIRTASSLVRTLSPSKGRPGIAAGREPVAIMILSDLTSWVTPSLWTTLATSGARTEPRPSMSVTPQLLNSARMPFTWVETTLSLRSRIFSRLYFTSPVSSTPNSPAFRARSRASADAIRVLVGMQPRCRQAPPTSSFSMTVTCAPLCAARIAATYPPGPEPMMVSCIAMFVPKGKRCPSTGEQGEGLLLFLFLEEFFVLVLGHQVVHFGGIAHFEHHEPAVAVGVLVDDLGRIGEVLVHFEDRSGNGADDRRRRLRGFDLGKLGIGVHFRIGLRQVHVHDVSQLLLREIGDAHGGALSLHPHPRVFSVVFDVIRIHGAPPVIFLK